MNFVSDRFEPVRELFESFLSADPRYSAQLAVYVNGTKEIDLVGGPDMSADSLTGVFSVSKGVSALAFSLLVQEGLIDLEAPVVKYWPEFGAHGKDKITVIELLSHQAGLVGVHGGFEMEEYNDLAGVADRIAAMEPQWRPGNGTFGYHALTMGVFLEELCLRVTGERLQDLYDRRIRAPYQADMFLGLPESEDHRYRDVLFDEVPGPFTDPYSLQGMSGNIQAGNLLLLPNIRSVRAAGSCSGAGVGSADGLARVYAAALTGIDGKGPYLSPETIAEVSQEAVWGVDRTFCDTSAFAMTFFKPQPRNDYGSAKAFGHDGANASLGFADPAYGIGFGYIPARAEEGQTGGHAMQLSIAVRKVLLGL